VRTVSSVYSGEFDERDVQCMCVCFVFIFTKEMELWYSGLGVDDGSEELDRSGSVSIRLSYSVGLLTLLPVTGDLDALCTYLRNAEYCD